MTGKGWAENGRDGVHVCQLGGNENDFVSVKRFKWAKSGHQC